MYNLEFWISHKKNEKQECFTVSLPISTYFVDQILNRHWQPEKWVRPHSPLDFQVSHLNLLKITDVLHEPKKTSNFNVDKFVASMETNQ